MTRRVVKPQPPEDVGEIVVSNYHPTEVDRDGEEYPGPEIYGAWDYDGIWGTRCPFGAPGDLLWVREAHAIVPRTAYALSVGVRQTLHPDNDYDAAVYRAGWERCAPGHWRPSIHMPRWASRLTLRVTAVRVERVQEITEADAVAEGIRTLPGQDPADPSAWWESAPGEHQSRSACAAFRNFWDSLNAKRGHGWDANPYVWVVSFEREGD